MATGRAPLTCVCCLRCVAASAGAGTGSAAPAAAGAGEGGQGGGASAQVRRCALLIPSLPCPALPRPALALLLRFCVPSCGSIFVLHPIPASRCDVGANKAGGKGAAGKGAAAAAAAAAAPAAPAAAPGERFFATDASGPSSRAPGGTAASHRPAPLLLLRSPARCGPSAWHNGSLTDPSKP